MLMLIDTADARHGRDDGGEDRPRAAVRLVLWLAGATLALLVADAVSPLLSWLLGVAAFWMLLGTLVAPRMHGGRRRR